MCFKIKLGVVQNACFFPTEKNKRATQLEQNWFLGMIPVTYILQVADLGKR